MLEKFSSRLLHLSTGLLTLICMVIFGVFSVLVLPDQAAKADAYSGEVGSPDTSLFYTASDLYRFAEAYGQNGRSAYIRARISFDLIFPLVYGAFLVTALSWLIKRVDLGRQTWGWANLLPVAGVIFDFLENGAAAVVMARYPLTTPVLDHLAGVLTLLKWVFIAASFLMLVVVLVFFLWRLIQRKR